MPNTTGIAKATFRHYTHPEQTAEVEFLIPPGAELEQLYVIASCAIDLEIRRLIDNPSLVGVDILDRSITIQY